RAMRAPVEVPLLACIAGVVAIAVLPWLGSPKRPAFNDRSVVVHWTAPPGTSLPEMNRITARASHELLALPAVADGGANFGRAQMSLTPGFVHQRVELPSEQPTIEVKVDVAKAERAGVKPGDVRRQAATLLSGLTVGNFFEEQKVFDVVVWGEPGVRGNLFSIR